MSLWLPIYIYLRITAQGVRIDENTRTYFCIENVMSDTMTAMRAAYDVLLFTGFQKSNQKYEK